MNEDPDVMRYFPRPWTAEESDAAFQGINASFDERDFGIYAVEVSSAFAGAVGLSTPRFKVGSLLALRFSGDSKPIFGVEDSHQKLRG
jgi:hypothetical protein